MATFIPSIEKIQQFRVQPTEGEWHLLHFLESTLDDSFEVYFNPFLNGDRPDVVVMRKGAGVMIIEVKDWDLDLYGVDDRRHWYLKHPKNAGESNAHLKSPIDQAYKYKENLYDLHIPGLLELKIKDIRNFNFVTCAVYFHNATRQQIDDFLIEPFKNDRKYQNFLKWNIDLIGRDTLNPRDFRDILFSRYLLMPRPSDIFTDDLYQSFCQHLAPTRHLLTDGEEISYSPGQKKLIFDQSSKQWRVRGVVGSGKTTVLAAKAVESVKRVMTEGREPNILILTYNITLKNFIRDKLSRVRGEFEWRYFTILNYHSFFGTVMNELGLKFDIPDKMPKESERSYRVRLSQHLDKKYYSNREVFKGYEDKISQYDAIFIDEIQDYLRPWMDIVRDYFLRSDGEYYLFGDVKQNIYSRQVSQKDISTNIIGAPRRLDTCFRADMKVRDLAVGFQNLYFSSKYDIESLVSPEDQASLFSRDELQKGTIRYINLNLPDPIIALNTIITGNMGNEENKNINPNDITILGSSIELLKKLDAFYRYKGNHKTATMFETYDLMFIRHLNYFSDTNTPDWIKALWKATNANLSTKKGKARANQVLGGFLARYEMYREYTGTFGPILEALAKRYKFDFGEFLKVITQHEQEYVAFRNRLFAPEADYEDIRNNKKLNFFMNTGTIKISTIHSFKGWESEVVFLLLEKKNEAERSFEELLYTGLTRTRSNLIVINLGNEAYHENMKRLIDAYK